MPNRDFNLEPNSLTFVFYAYMAISDMRWNDITLRFCCHITARFCHGMPRTGHIGHWYASHVIFQKLDVTCHTTIFSYCNDLCIGLYVLCNATTLHLFQRFFLLDLTHVMCELLNNRPLKWNTVKIGKTHPKS